MNEKPGLCLNIGCGLDAPFEWLNFDSSYSLRFSRIPIIGRKLVRMNKWPNWPAAAQYGDIVKGLNIPHASIDLIFVSHVLEHLSFSDFHTAMNNIYAYLKRGGIFRTIVPDLKTYIDRYNYQINKSSVPSRAAYEFIENMNIGYSESRRHLIFRFYEVFRNSRHQWMWDAPSLLSAFDQHRFINVRLCEYGDWLDVRFKLVERKERHTDAICIDCYKK